MSNSITHKESKGVHSLITKIKIPIKASHVNDQKQEDENKGSLEISQKSDFSERTWLYNFCSRGTLKIHLYVKQWCGKLNKHPHIVNTVEYETQSLELVYTATATAYFNYFGVVIEWVLDPIMMATGTERMGIKYQMVVFTLWQQRKTKIFEFICRCRRSVNEPLKIPK